MLKISAPGKLMLFGEHAVVYERPCIVVAIDHRMEVSLGKREDNKINLNAPEMNFKDYLVSLDDLEKPHPKEVRFVLTAIKNFFEVYNLESGLEVETKSQFSAKFGLGSSSAVTVSTIKGLSELFRIKISQKELFNLAHKTVLDIQGVGSGFDLAAAVYGGTLFFLTGGKVIEQIKVKNLPIVIGYTGVKADTVTLVKMVAEKLAKEPERINKVFNEIEKVVKLTRGEIENSDWRKVGELMNLNQNLLRELGVSSKELESLIKAALKGGAYGAKLSGAGGGDCMIAIAEKEDRDKVKEMIKRAGGEITKAKVDSQGVRVEK